MISNVKKGSLSLRRLYKKYRENIFTQADIVNTRNSCELFEKYKDIEILKLSTVKRERRLWTFIENNPESFDINRYEKWIHVLDSTKRGAVYSPLYWKYLKNIKDSDAKDSVAIYKRRKATNLTGFIERHGEDTGHEMFEKFQKTSTISIDNRKKSGCNFKEYSLWCKDYWIKRGMDKISSVEAVSEFQKNNSGMYSPVWERKGYTDEEIDIILKASNEKKGAAYCPRKLSDKDNISISDAEIIISERKNRMVTTNIKKGRATPLESRGEFKRYQYKVRYLSDKQDLSSLDNINKRGKGYDLDHKYSILQAFLNGIPEKIVSSICNLQCIPTEVNLKKSHNCSISKIELYTLFNNIEKEKQCHK